MRPYLFVLVILILAFVANVGLGAVAIPFGSIVSIVFDGTSQSTLYTIIVDVRLPHALLILLTGGALASSGAAYQGLFRNPLADPYLIGVASGAGLSAVLVMSVPGVFEGVGVYAIPLAAFLGALVTVVVVYSLARVDNYLPLTTLILAGVAVGAFASAITTFVMLRSDGQLYRALSFLFGGSPVSGWQPVWVALPYFVIGMLGLSFSGFPLNVLQFGDEQAQQLGLNVNFVKVIILVFATIATAAAVAFSGIIGFVGLIVPHILRLIIGSDYRRLIPLSIFVGASLLLFADALSRVVLAPQTIPVGIVTALSGAPFFLWILRRAKREVFW